MSVITPTFGKQPSRLVRPIADGNVVSFQKRARPLTLWEQAACILLPVSIVALMQFAEAKKTEWVHEGLLNGKEGLVCQVQDISAGPTSQDFIANFRGSSPQRQRQLLDHTNIRYDYSQTLPAAQDDMSVPQGRAEFNCWPYRVSARSSSPALGG